MNGKGSKPRPLSVPQKQFDDNWDNIFKKPKKKTPKKQVS
jgi:hypothetical protein